MSKHKTTKRSYKKMFLLVGIAAAYAVLLKRDTPKIKA